MKPLEFLFAILKQFIPFSGNRYSDLRDQADKWEASVRNGEKDSPIKKALLFCENWYIQVAFAIAFLVSVKHIGNWLMSNNDPTLLDEDDEEYDEDDAPSTGGRKFNIGGRL